VLSLPKHLPSFNVRYNLHICCICQCLPPIHQL
jgi:hypothetical protein